jgi:hypothetical protein
METLVSATENRKNVLIAQQLETESFPEWRNALVAHVRPCLTFTRYTNVCPSAFGKRFVVRVVNETGVARKRSYLDPVWPNLGRIDWPF